VIDSGSVHFRDVVEEQNPHYLTGSFTIPTNAGTSYVLKLSIRDQLRGTEDVNYLFLNRSTPLNRQHFLAVDPQSGTPYFRDWVHSDEVVRIKSTQDVSPPLFVRHYQRDFPIAPPPFALFNPKPFDYKADSTYIILPEADGSYLVHHKKQGFYHYQLDSTSREGLTLFNYGPSFPKMNKPENMLPPLRFITSSNEYERMMSTKTPKKELDEFWLTLGKSPDRARELIRSFYNRVENANSFFSCHQVGWKTDRGVIYIVFGPPDIIYKSDNGERWVYGEENNYLSMTFDFIRVNNPFSNNDYQLRRNPIYKNQWYRAVDGWRNGRVSSLTY